MEVTKSRLSPWTMVFHSAVDVSGLWPNLLHISLLYHHISRVCYRVIRAEPPTNPSYTHVFPRCRHFIWDQGASPALTPPTRAALLPLPEQLAAGRWLVGVRDEDTSKSILRSGNLTVCYWKWSLIVDSPIKDGDFPVRYVDAYQRVLSWTRTHWARTWIGFKY